MKKTIIWSVLLIAIFGAIAANYYWRQQKALAPEPPQQAQASAPEEKPAIEPEKSEPAIRFPIEDIKSQESAAQRPITRRISLSHNGLTRSPPFQSERAPAFDAKVLRCCNNPNAFWSGYARSDYGAR